MSVHTPASRTIRLQRIEGHVQTRRALHQELERLIDELLSYPDGAEIVARILAEVEAQQDGNTAT